MSSFAPSLQVWEEAPEGVKKRERSICLWKSRKKETDQKGRGIAKGTATPASFVWSYLSCHKGRLENESPRVGFKRKLMRTLGFPRLVGRQRILEKWCNWNPSICEGRSVQSVELFEARGDFSLWKSKWNSSFKNAPLRPSDSTGIEALGGGMPLEAWRACDEGEAWKVKAKCVWNRKKINQDVPLIRYQFSPSVDSTYSTVCMALRYGLP